MGYLDQWFPDMVTCVADICIEGDVCTLLGLCKKATTIFTPRDWTCEECADILARSAAYMAEEDTIAEAVAWLQGDCFCGQDGQTADCPDLIATILPLAMPVLGQALVEQTAELCQEAVGVC